MNIQRPTRSRVLLHCLGGSAAAALMLAAPLSASAHQSGQVLPATVQSASVHSTSVHSTSVHSTSVHSLIVHAVSAPVIMTSALPPFELGRPYDETIDVTGTTPLTFTLSGSLPKGVDFDTMTGRLHGTPDLSTTASSFAFTVKVKNTVSEVAGGYTVTVLNPSVAPKVTTASVDAATVGQPYTFQFTGSGTPKPTFSLEPSPLLAGLMLDPATGILSGIPTASGSGSLFVKATNAAGETTDIGFSFVVNPAVGTTPTPTPSPGGGGGQPTDPTGGTQTTNPTDPTTTIQPVDPLAPGARGGSGAGAASGSHLASTGADASGFVVGGLGALLLAALGFAAVVIRRIRRVTE